MKRSVFLLFFVVAMGAVNAQQLNQYRDVVVPWEYSFLKSANQYQLNELTKFLFDQEGFNTRYDHEEKSASWSKDPCEVLTVNVASSSTMFTTKLTITLKDCHNKVVFTSAVGKSKLKEYKKGHQEALRKAFASIKALNYTYEGKASNVQMTAVEDATDLDDAVEMIIVEETDGAKVQNEGTKVDLSEAANEGFVIPKTGELLYAQPTKLGFQLIDRSPKVVFVLLESAKKDLFILENSKGVVYKQGEKWFVDLYVRGVFSHVELTIKW